MTQREYDPPRVIPHCSSGHRPRYIFDARRLASGGGHTIQCRCSATPKAPSFDLAWAHWHKMQRVYPLPEVLPAREALPQLQLRLVGGTKV